jgi:hypothetical protein
MKVYKIYTEDKNQEALVNLLTYWIPAWIPGFTMYKATGSWRGTIEKSLVIEIIVSELGNKYILDIKSHLTKQIKALNDQGDVLWTCQEVSAEFPE